MNIKFFLTPQGSVHAVFESLRHEIPGATDHYYEGFGTPPHTWNRCIEPLLIKNRFLEQCRQVCEDDARLIHPELFRHLEARVLGGEFYTKIMGRDIMVDMCVLVCQSFHTVCDVIGGGETVLIEYRNEDQLSRTRSGGLWSFDPNESIVRIIPTSLVA
jgi:hypothetical protein